MKKILISTLFLVIAFQYSNAQKENIISVFGGKTFMGTGDLRGFNLGFGYQHLFNKHFGIETNLRATSATIRNQFPMADTKNANEGFNTEFRATTSGYQLEMLAVLPVINNFMKLNLFAGPVFRRQYNTLPKTYGVNYDKDFTTTFLSIHYAEPLNTHSVGLSAQIELAFKFKHKNYLAARLAGHSYLGDLNWYFPLVYQRKI